MPLEQGCAVNEVYSRSRDLAMFLGLYIRIITMLLIRYVLSFLLLFSSSLLADDYDLPNKEWRIISLPSIPPAGENTVEKVFGDDILGQYGTDWIMYGFDTQTNSYGEALKPNDPVEHGRGYWITQITGHPVTLKMPSGSTEATEKYSLQLASVAGGNSTQWTLSGNPFSSSLNLGELSLKTDSGACSSTPCNLDKAETEKLLHNQVWVYDGNGYVQKDKQSMLNAWGGFWAASLGNSQGRELSLLKATKRADIKGVTVTGSEGRYTFAVKIRSDDTGWDQYADRWEVLNGTRGIIYQRVLGHPHVNEQPFTRSGTSINIEKGENIYIRAHLKNMEYAGDILVGSVEDGFRTIQNIGEDCVLNGSQTERPKPEWWEERCGDILWDL